jgi:hypothetical protein
VEIGEELARLGIVSAAYMFTVIPINSLSLIYSRGDTVISVSWVINDMGLRACTILQLVVDSIDVYVDTEKRLSDTRTI